jgi:4-hydroxybenzoyl-CoA reductase subunit beta
VHLDPFELHTPTSVGEAVALSQELQGKFDWLAGGTDLLPNYKMHLNLRPHLISLAAIPELQRWDTNWLGAMVRLADLERSPEFARSFPGVHSAVSSVATPLVRASGTVGGNLLLETRCFFFNQSYFWRESLGFCLKAEGDRCHVVPQKERCYATFSGDLAPTLMVLGAEVELAGASGRRRLPLAELYNAQGDGILRTHLTPGELLVGVHLPKAANGTPAVYQKLRVRPSFDFPELGVAVAGRRSGSSVESLEIAVGGLETRPRKFDELTRPLVGSTLDAGKMQLVAEQVRQAVRPVYNTFLAPDYRRKMTSVWVRRSLEAWAQQAGFSS